MAVVAQRHPTLVDQVTAGLTDQIRSGFFPAGSMLPSMQSLSDAYGVSRTVTREALAKLSAEGMITSRQGLGVFVAERPPAQKLSLVGGRALEDTKRVLELRLGVETEAAGFAAVRRTEEDLEKIGKAIEAIAAFDAADDVDQSVDADLQFHLSICAATGNGHFESFFAFLSQYYRENVATARRNSVRRGLGSAPSDAEHAAIFGAIVRGDAKGARAAARTHVLNTAKRLQITIDDA